MKKKISITSNAKKKHLRELRSNYKRKQRRKKFSFNYSINKSELKGDYSYQNQIKTWLPYNISYILNHEKTKFFEDLNLEQQYLSYKVFVPAVFCLITKQSVSYGFIKELTFVLLSDRYQTVEIDYGRCKQIDLSAQIYLDIILEKTVKLTTTFQSKLTIDFGAN